MRGYFPVLFLPICFLMLSGTALASGENKAAVTILPPPVLNAVSNASSPDKTLPFSSIEMKDCLVSVNVKNEMLSNVLSRLGQKAGFTYSIYPALYTKKITTNFSGLPLEKGLRRILDLAGAKNYRMVYGKDGRLAAVKIFDESKPKSQTPQRAINVRPSPIEPGSRATQLRPPRISRPQVSPAPPHVPSGGDGIPDELLKDPENTQAPSGDN